MNEFQQQHTPVNGDDSIEYAALSGSEREAEYDRRRYEVMASARAIRSWNNNRKPGWEPALLTSVDRLSAALDALDEAEDSDLAAMAVECGGRIL